jgi:hypothetical protein
MHAQLTKRKIVRTPWRFKVPNTNCCKT